MKSEASPGRFVPDFVLAAVTLVWGSSFVVVKNVLETAPPLAFLAVRFLLAALLLAPWVVRRRESAKFARDSLLLGALLALGMGAQVVGQVETTASKAAFITGLSTPLTPIYQVLRTRRLPRLENILGIVLASSGFFLLTFPGGGGRINRGDVMVLGCAVAFAVYIVELSLRAERHDSAALAGAQLWVVALLAAACSPLLRALPAAHLGIAAAETRPVPWNGAFLFGVAYLGSVGTVGTFLGQTWAQRFMSATHAAILFTIEPVFAALLAAWLLRERLGLRGGVGAALVLAGIVISELRPGQSRDRVQQ